MTISVFDVFKIGIGPSSSHTVGPMLAALSFARNLADENLLSQLQQIKIDLYGSLGATGKGHGTHKAVMLGLSGNAPDTIDPDCIATQLEKISESACLNILAKQQINFDAAKHIVFHRKALPFHANGMRFTAQNKHNSILAEKEYYSVGGGFVVSDTDSESNIFKRDDESLPYPFTTAETLLKLCALHECSVGDIMLQNEKIRMDEVAIKQKLVHIWQVMQECIQRGLKAEGVLPGGMKVKRRAADLFKQLNLEIPSATPNIPVGTLDWVNLYALAVSEENAAGGRIVTAPTNGAAGIIPAVLHYYWQFCAGANEEGIVRFLLTAAAIALLYKENASLSGAEVGCQGEVGVACSMAAGALAEVLGGTPEQVENAAEIGMEHNLGLTCDPVGGLVQVPCIERNAMGSVKAINAARIALRGDGSHFVSLDKVIKTMRETGADMKTKYKETSRGGLAVNLIEC